MLDPRAHDVIAPFGLGGDLPVHRLGFGAMRITGPGIWGPPPNHDEAVAVLRRAVERGVNLIDTADSYGPFVSERLIAEALRPYPEDLVIATKGGLLRDGPDQWRPDGRPQHLRARVRSEHAASEAGTDPAVPVPPRRPAGPARGLHRHDHDAPRRRQDSPHRRLQRERGATRSGARHHTDRFGAEPLRTGDARFRVPCRPVRTGRARVLAVGAIGPRRRREGRDHWAHRGGPRRDGRDRLPWPGCSRARRSCCLSPVPVRSSTSTRT